MIFSLQNLKKFIYSIKNKNIEQIYIKDHTLELVINKNKKNNQLNSILNKKISIDLEKSSQNKAKNTYQIDNIEKNQGNNHKFIKDKMISQDESKIYSTIISPMVGTFYRCPGANELPFIEINDFVKKKQTVCIIEAMKLMNEIESEVNGEIIEVLVHDGDIVDCGQALMKVKI